MKRLLVISFYLILTIILSITTQIGGIIILISLIISNIWKVKFRFKTTTIFVGLYLISTYLIVPHIAVLFGREKIKNTKHIYPVTHLTALLNRNYVKPKMNHFLQSVSAELQKSDCKFAIRYLDANFPFIEGFPLLPHFSHKDGKKLDLSFVYEDINGNAVNKSKSISGYGVFSNPFPDEFDQCKACKDKGYYQYDYPKYITLGSINDELKFSFKANKKLINALLNQPELQKIFIEPHLKKRLGITDKKVRFHGCRSVRHDDHIHLQIK